MLARPDTIREIADRCHLVRKRLPSYGPGTAIDCQRGPQMGDGHSIDSGGEHSSPSPAIAHPQALARRKPGNSPMSNYPPKRKHTPAFATCRRAESDRVAHRAGGRKTASSFGPRVLRELVPGAARRAVCTPRIAPDEKIAVPERRK